MTTVTGPATKLPAYCKWLGLYYLLVGVLMVLPTFLNVVHIQWLPSPAFASQIRVIALLVGLATSLSCLLMFKHIERIRKVGKDSQGFAAALLLCLFLAVCGYYSTITTVPMVAAVLSGEVIEMTFTVEKIWPFPVKYCGRAIELSYLSPHYGTLCGVAPEFMEQLHPGSEIVVSGRGTSWGLFANNARLADGNQTGMP
ncbi:hypothetical protein CXZ10_14960 [Pleomorphomonas diazotrophica]|uniref:Uncharacterized protein n=1 Tax=Pleomorphomonas diazotrophica TaxID=1166257 RepID=A0A1I4UP86_9HYPH|nr:hypothetical protein [Pleomorphomonas diazotrophica]PKR88319.1 hypothetical protein CXZ10_14960 [Pleomorphomonas diazotrophica]SFM90817.1 hypothetical protein SAMN05192571_108199 [Pleomorphomonas diazotrophica]